VNNKKPIIAAVDGIAIGIGTTMVFHCDYVIASTTATFSSPFFSMGLSRRALPAYCCHGWLGTSAPSPCWSWGGP
jgi:hypothetical protein